jgi:CRP/FNR family transcriptional regulator, cyclic AMP receptor protein
MSLPELNALLQANFPALVTPAATLAQIAPLLHLRRLSAGAVVFAQGGHTPALWGVISGAVEIRLGSMDGAISVIETVTSGRLFGLASFATGRPSPYEALASRPTRLLAIGPAAYARLMDEVPGLARALLAELAARHHDTMQLLGAARHHNALERLSLALLRLPSSPGPSSRTDAPGWRHVSVTQADLAALAGLSRQTVNSLLTDLAKQGALRRVYGGLWLAPAPASRR